MIKSLMCLLMATAAYGGIIVDPAFGIPDGVPAETPLLKNSPECNFCKGVSCSVATDDCRTFLVCRYAGSRTHIDGTSTRIYTSTVSPCAFGTFFDQSTGICNVPENSGCANDQCKVNPGVMSYPHLGSNCRTYWECSEFQVSVAKCCPTGRRYDSGTKTCVIDATCTSRCPTKAGSCMLPGTEKAQSDDNNCRTYWDCKMGGSPHPVCCPGNQAFDTESSSCVPDSTCLDICPDVNINNPCNTQGVPSYKLSGNKCRTYMKCATQEGDKDMRMCCRHDNFYNTDINACVPMPVTQEPTDPLFNCTQDCPTGYKEVCHLIPVPGVNNKYIVPLLNGGETTMPCAEGTTFSVDLCGCGVNVKDPVDNRCNLNLNMIFDYPTTIRTGSERQSSLTAIGKPDQGDLYMDKATFVFTGQYRIKLDITKRPLAKTFVNLQFSPSSQGPAYMILFSNCGQQTSDKPSFEISLQGGNVVVDVVTNEGAASVMVPYQNQLMNNLFVSYDGSNLEAFLTGQNAPVQASAPVIGIIKLPVNPMQVGGCSIEAGTGFVGSLYSLAWSSCFKDSFLPQFTAGGV